MIEYTGKRKCIAVTASEGTFYGPCWSIEVGDLIEVDPGKFAPAVAVLDNVVIGDETDRFIEALNHGPLPRVHSVYKKRDLDNG